MFRSGIPRGPTKTFRGRGRTAHSTSSERLSNGESPCDLLPGIPAYKSQHISRKARSARQSARSRAPHPPNDGHENEIASPGGSRMGCHIQRSHTSIIGAYLPLLGSASSPHKKNTGRRGLRQTHYIHRTHRIICTPTERPESAYRIPVEWT